MEIFSMVNEVAVIGTTLFMTAFAIIWYSEYLFKKQWMNSVGLSETDVESQMSKIKRNFVITIVTYAITIFFIALIIGYAQFYGFSVQKTALSITIAFSSFLAGFTLWEQRPLAYYLITVGFSSVFIMGSSFFLYHWPW